MKETAPNRIYDNDNELVAFQTQTVHLKKDTSNIHLVLFKQDPDKFRVDKKFDNDGKMLFTFNKGIDNPSVTILYPPALDAQKIVEFSKTRDTAFVYSRNMDFDSIRVSFLQNNKPIDTLTLRKGRKESFTRSISLQYNVTPDGRLKPGTDLSIISNLPIDAIDNSIITLNEDSTNVSNFTIVKDTANLRKFVIKYRWKPDARYQVIFNEGALTDIYGDKNKKLPKIFQLDKADNYGQLTLKISIPDTSKGYVIELLNDQKKLLRSDAITKKTSLVYKNYLVGKYYIRVVYDDNKNGKWDSGNVKKRRQPENIWLYEKVITLRSNWEAEEPIDIPKEPVTP